MTQEDSELQPEGKLWLLVILVLLIFAASLIYFGRNNPALVNLDQARISNPGSSRTSRIYTVFYNTGVFSPTNIRIHVGDSVKFQNDGDQPIHIQSDSTNNIPDLVGFDSVGDVPAKGSFTYTFSTAGIFGYHNKYDKNERGTVIVRP